MRKERWVRSKVGRKGSCNDELETTSMIHFSHHQFQSWGEYWKINEFPSQDAELYSVLELWKEAEGIDQVGTKIAGFHANFSSQSQRLAKWWSQCEPSQHLKPDWPESKEKMAPVSLPFSQSHLIISYDPTNLHLFRKGHSGNSPR